MSFKKQLFLEFDDSVSPEYQKWTFEAVADFIDLFPKELADRFEIHRGDSGDGRFGNQVLKDFLDRQELYNNDVLDLPKFYRERKPSMLEPDGRYNTATPIPISITTNQGNIFGIGGGAGVLVSIARCEELCANNPDINKEEFFKDVIMHELGHAFEATYKGRDKVQTKDDAGTHCIEDDCLMDEHAINPDNFRKRHAKAPYKPFCDDCLRSLQEFVEHDFKCHAEFMVIDDPQNLPENREEDDSFKIAWRLYAKKTANALQATYEEDEENANFAATITQQDGTKTFIMASSQRDVSLSAKDSDGNEVVPDQIVFTKLADKIYADGNNCNFGNIQTPEFMARLMIACMDRDDRVKMTNQPEVNEEFLSSITPKSAAKLRELMELPQQNRTITVNQENNNNGRGTGNPHGRSTGR